MGFLKGKKILISGIASKMSIAYGIAKSMYKQNAELALTYQNNKIKSRVKDYAKIFDTEIVLQCDVSDDNSIANLFSDLAVYWPKFDGFVHSIGFAPSNQLEGDYINVIDRKSFIITHDVSAYSFVAMAKKCYTMLNANSSLITITYLGSERFVPNYNVMGPAKASLEASVKYMASSMGPNGIRVNAISSGPIKTLAASGIKDFRKMLSYCKSTSPLRRTVTIEEVGNVAAFLCSNLASGITGEIIYVDGGFNITAISNH